MLSRSRRTRALGLWLGLSCCWLAGHATAGAVDVAAGGQQRGCAYGGRVYAVGERWATGPPDKCAKYLCQDDDQFVALTCPWFVPAPGCTPVPGDDRDVYPGCCPTRKCHDPVDVVLGGDVPDDDAPPPSGPAAAAPTTTTRRTMSWRPGALRSAAAEATAEAADEATTEAVTEQTTATTGWSGAEGADEAATPAVTDAA